MALELDVDVEVRGGAPFSTILLVKQKCPFCRENKLSYIEKKKEKKKIKTELSSSHSSKCWWPFFHLTFRSYPYICQCIPPIPCACLNGCLDLQWKKAWFTNPCPHMLEDQAIPAYWWCLQCCHFASSVGMRLIPSKPPGEYCYSYTEDLLPFFYSKEWHLFQFLISSISGSEVGKMISVHLINKARNPAAIYSQFPVRIFVG